MRFAAWKALACGPSESLTPFIPSLRQDSLRPAWPSILAGSCLRAVGEAGAQTREPASRLMSCLQVLFADRIWD